ncbi:type VI secretion system baseplate subunit TssE [Glaciimonas soli]|uniref:Type VI secretion system baseplate subunit TssE n=1 Tax=Glaciimonas soli TaxID=2590999 RepID=A0A843YSH2_9BURK|nr:type VI secretion system baseplate subunit TssE [Glaciimonas soli]MQR02090.1 type VI secretion system baseplate subunit TssE [Glaciimonas soli]
MQRISSNKLTSNDNKTNHQTKPKARPHAHLLPTLFDRLRDDAPQRKTEASGEYTVSRKQLCEIIQRDLAYLLNTTNIEDLIDRDAFPEAAASTINFGVPALAGSYLSTHKWEKIELMIRRAITNFEPRLVPGTLLVTPLLKNDGTNHYNVLLFEIRGQIQMDPYPMEFMVQSSVDLETNRMSIVSSSAR